MWPFLHKHFAFFVFESSKQVPFPEHAASLSFKRGHDTPQSLPRKPFLHLHTVFPSLLFFMHLPRLTPPQTRPNASRLHFMAQSEPLKPVRHWHLPPCDPDGIHLPCPEQIRPLESFGQVTLHLLPRYPLLHLQKVTFLTSS